MHFRLAARHFVHPFHDLGLRVNCFRVIMEEDSFLTIKGGEVGSVTTEILRNIILFIYIFIPNPLAFESLRGSFASIVC